MVILIVEEAASVSEFVLHGLDLLALLLDHSLHLLSQLVLEVLLLLFELLLHLGRSALVLLHSSLRVSLRLSYTVMHTLDLSLLLIDS